MLWLFSGCLLFPENGCGYPSPFFFLKVGEKQYHRCQPGNTRPYGEGDFLLFRVKSFDLVVLREVQYHDLHAIEKEMEQDAAPDVPCNHEQCAQHNPHAQNGN